jgi:hypothetical protein
MFFSDLTEEIVSKSDRYLNHFFHKYCGELKNRTRVYAKWRMQISEIYANAETMENFACAYANSFIDLRCTGSRNR